MSRGTPHTEAINTVLEQHHVPMVGPSTGAIAAAPAGQTLHLPRGARHLPARGPACHGAICCPWASRVVVVHVDDSFGADGLKGAPGLQQGRLEPVVAVAKSTVPSPTCTAAAHARGGRARRRCWSSARARRWSRGFAARRRPALAGQHLTLSNNASEGFVKLLGADAKGVVVSQVMPSSLNWPGARSHATGWRGGLTMSPGHAGRHCRRQGTG